MNATPAWMDSASCAQTGDPDAWFPGMGQTSHLAVRICQACPVREMCAEYAIADPSLEGTWAGMSSLTRQRIRTARKAAS